MNIKQNIRFQLEHMRGMTMSALQGFNSREDYLFQPHNNANHALWIVTHLGMADNFMMSFVRPETSDFRDELWGDRYWIGSKPSNVDSDNISTSDAIEYLNQRRENVLDVLESVNDDQMNLPFPPDCPFSGFPNLGHIFLFNAQHEAMHFGQLSVCHRGIGNAPLFQPSE